MPTEQEFAYAAGLFDGEGTIDMKDRVRMAVKMTDREPIEALVDILGGHFYQWKNTKSGRPTYEWRAAGWEGTMDTIFSIRNYVVGKRRQLDVVGNYYEYRDQYGVIEEAKQAAAFQLRELRRVNMQPVTFDIETMGLDSKTLPMLSCHFQIGDDEQGVWSETKVQRPQSDEQLALAIRETLEGYPYSIGFNSIRFDIPWINERLSIYGHRAMFLGSHDDVSPMYDKMMGRNKRTSLKNAVDEQGLADDEKHKTPIDWVKWNAANAGDQIAQDYVNEHGNNDVVLTKRLYNVTTQ